jgi:V-type H+-transporting ATPase 21kDa proteolipid subunit
MANSTIVGWSDILLGVDPYYYASAGTALSIGLSVIGAACGILLTGSSLLGASIKVHFLFICLPIY